MKQGDVCWFRFREPDKKRPVLILTRNSAIPYLTGLTVAPITSTVRGVPSEVLLTPSEDGMLQECVDNSHNLQTVPKDRIEELITQLSIEGLREVRSAIEFALGFDALN
jgi:mRNA interferase MazF